MKPLIDCLCAAILFLILLLLGELLMFLPVDCAVSLTIGYAAMMLAVSFFVPARSSQTVALSDFLLSLGVLMLFGIVLQDQMNLDQWLYLAFAIVMATVSFGCNRRFGNRIHTQNSASAQGNH